MMPNIGNLHFNPRPPCGGRQLIYSSLHRADEFQSTSSVWRTTNTPIKAYNKIKISIHVLRVEDDPPFHHTYEHTAISIHVLRVEDDSASDRIFCTAENFNPRPPCGGRPLSVISSRRTPIISIHVLRVEDDARTPQISPCSLNFNPRPPCGGRRFHQLLEHP